MTIVNRALFSYHRALFSLIGITVPFKSHSLGFSLAGKRAQLNLGMSQLRLWACAAKTDPNVASRCDLKGVAENKARFIPFVKGFEAKNRQLFAMFDTMIALITRYSSFVPSPPVFKLHIRARKRKTGGLVSKVTWLKSTYLSKKQSSYLHSSGRHPRLMLPLGDSYFDDCCLEVAFWLCLCRGRQTNRLHYPSRMRVEWLCKQELVSGWGKARGEERDTTTHLIKIRIYAMHTMYMARG